MEDDRRQDNVEEDVRVEVELLPHAVVHHQANGKTCEPNNKIQKEGRYDVLP